MDPEAAGVEGVSGATMTSLAIADTLVAAADKFRISEAARRTARQQGESWASRFVDRAVAELTALRWTAADLACLVMLAGIPVFRALGWFRRRWLRRGWLLTAVIVIGFWSGNLISMALVAGWSAEGVAWQLAPALAAVAAVAFLSPAAGKSNPYCNHLCPHGALQQLIRPHRHSRRHWQPPARLVKAIAYLPGTLLVAAYLTLLIAPATDLSSWEPFHAYLFRIAPWSAVVLAVVTLMLAARIPMAYCRLGCPTGRLLDHLRRSANSHRLGPSDVVAFALLLLALGVRWAGGS
jgi:polyferredoxin